MGRRTSWLAVSAVCCALTAAGAQTVEFTPGANLVLRYGGVPIVTGDSLLLMDSGYKGLDSALSSPKLERTAKGETVRYELTRQAAPGAAGA